MFFTIITVLLSPSKLNYKNPIKITWPKSVTDVDVDLYCSATDGYPAFLSTGLVILELIWPFNQTMGKSTRTLTSSKIC